MKPADSSRPPLPASPSAATPLPSTAARLASTAVCLPSTAARLPSTAAPLPSTAARLPSSAARLAAHVAAAPGPRAAARPTPFSRPTLLAFPTPFAFLTLLMLLALLTACGEAAPEMELRVQVDTIGDTVVVRNAGGGPLGDAELVAEVRIGSIEGRDEEMLGAVAGLAVSPEGVIYVYDRQVPALRAYDAAGRFVRTLGRKGGGPGEYENSDGGIAVLSDGRIVLRDPGNARYNVWRPDGEAAGSWTGRGGFFTSSPLFVDDEDRLYTQTIRAVADGERATSGSLWITRLLRLGSDGAPGDTLDIPDFGYESPTIVATRNGGTSMNNVPFMPAHTWSFRPDGSILAGIGDRYAVYVFRPEGPVLRVEREAERVPVSSAERDDARERATFQMRQMDPSWRWNGPPVPDVKPALSRVFGARDDRIWVLAPQEAEAIEWSEEDHARAGDPERSPPPRFREPVVFDVFEPDGRYLGRVRAPEGFATYPVPVFRGDHVWAVEQDEFGINYVVRYRIEPAPSAVGGGRATVADADQG